MIKTYLRILLLRALDISGINALCRTLNRHKAIILWYHGISDDGFGLLRGFDERHIPKSLFRKHLEYLKRQGYIFVSMTDLLNAIKNKKRIDKFVVLTFDDGFRNIVENAYPIMKDFSAKGCFYLVSDLIGTNELLWTDFVETVIRNQKKGNFQFVFKGEKIDYVLDDKYSYQDAMKDIKAKLRSISDRARHEHLEQFNSIELDDVPREFTMATWEQINQLDKNLLEIGSHTRRHPNCVNLTSNEELEDEIKNSKVDIEKNTGYQIKHFCYPAGSYDDRVVAKVIEYGYESAVTTAQGFNDESSDLYRLKRIEANEQFLFFKAGVSGSYNLLRRIKAVLS